MKLVKIVQTSTYIFKVLRHVGALRKNNMAA